MRSFGMPISCALSTQSAGNTKRQPESSARNALVVLLKWSPCQWVMKCTSRCGASSTVGIGEGCTRVSIQIQVDRVQPAALAEEPAEITEPQQVQIVAGGEKFLQRGDIHRLVSCRRSSLTYVRRAIPRRPCGSHTPEFCQRISATGH